MCGMENNLQIPYGIFDIKRIRYGCRRVATAVQWSL
jgi:hypothetical protein